jgi:hypothetical protein
MPVMSARFRWVTSISVEQNSERQEVKALYHAMVRAKPT